jgi:hypothetical protein
MLEISYEDLNNALEELKQIFAGNDVLIQEKINSILGFDLLKSINGKIQNISKIKKEAEKFISSINKFYNIESRKINNI